LDKIADIVTKVKQFNYSDWANFGVYGSNFRFLAPFERNVFHSFRAYKEVCN